MCASRWKRDRDILSNMFSFFSRKTRQNRVDLSKVQAVLFDLDGTLIDVDMNRFVPIYLHRLTQYMGGQVSPERAIRTLHNAVGAMFANLDVELTLEAILLEYLQVEVEVSPELYAESLEQFYRNDLEELKPLVTGHPLAMPLIESSRGRDWKVVLATNPIFPRNVIDARLAWGQLDGEAFHHVTDYETSHFCKPSPLFFEEVLERLQLPAEACLMVGNDTLHDLSASQVGMQTCLLTPWRINRPGAGFPADWQGSHEALLDLFAT